MDEPLSNLDLKLRESMRIELAKLHRELGITIIYVTHDQAEAMTLSTALAVMRQGEVQQVGQPAAVYARPVNTFVARFIGSPSMNLFRMTLRQGRLYAVGSDSIVLPAPRDLAGEEGRELLVGVRPHHLRVVAGDHAGIPVLVTLTEHLGRNNFVVLSPDGDTGYLYQQESIQIETDEGTSYQAGDRLVLTAAPETIRIFDAATGMLDHSTRRPPPPLGKVEIAAGASTWS
jgi:ABC-type sugar transport system ATPase subunit